MDNKTDFRLKAKSIRKSLDIAYISELITQNIRQSDTYKKAKNIMIYYPLNGEISLLSLLNDNKNFYLPRVKDSELEVCPYNIGDNLEISEFKVKEPICEAVDKNILDIVYVPALAVDENLNRLGYGKGYYDRFFNSLKALKIAVIPSELVFRQIPTDEYDKKCDGFITQKKASF